MLQCTVITSGTISVKKAEISPITAGATSHATAVIFGRGIS